MTNRSAILDDTLAKLRAAGVTPEIKHGSRHLHVRFTNQFGHPCVVIISRGTRQPSRRALWESRATLRRLLRKNGESPPC